MQSIGRTPLENLIMDFTEMPRVQGCKYLLVFVYTFSEYVEAFLMWIEKAWDIARCLLKEIIPQFGIPVSIGSDNGPAFVQLVAKGFRNHLKVTYDLPLLKFRKSGTYD
jgi:hypothetical protein